MRLLRRCLVLRTSQNSCSTTFVNKGNNRAEVARTQRLLPYSPEYLQGEVPEVCPYQCSQKNMRGGRDSNRTPPSMLASLDDSG